jgi:hypothetical protein
MQVRLNTDIAYYVNSDLRTAQIGEVVTDFSDTEATSMVLRGIASWVIDEVASEETQAVPVKPARKRGA